MIDQEGRSGLLSKKNIVGIIAEYNPFHNGHLYHINRSLETICADALVVVLSSNFVQRGEPAFLDKWSRTDMALHYGADLVSNSGGLLMPQCGYSALPRT